MYLKKIALVLALSFLFLGVGAPSAKAVTIDELLVQIAALQAQLVALQSQQTATVVWCHDFNTNLRIGDVGPEVAALQSALVKEGFDIDSQELRGGQTFEETTAAAVVGFQIKYKSEILTPSGLKNGTGFVGKATRAKLNKLYGCGITTPPSIGTPSITVLSPNGGEKWQQNSTQLIKWNAPTATRILLTVIDKNGMGIEPAVLSNIGSFSWIVSGQPGDYKVKISICPASPEIDCTNIGNLSYDTSDNYFSIVAAATIVATDSDNSPDYTYGPSSYPVTPEKYPDLFTAGVGKGDYIGGGPCIYGAQPNPNSCQQTSDNFTTYYDYCVSPTQLNEAFVNSSGKLSALGISPPTGYTCSNGAFVKTATGGVCTLSNGCFGRTPGSTYRCASSGSYDANGAGYCTCNSDCSVTNSQPATTPIPPATTPAKSITILSPKIGDSVVAGSRIVLQWSQTGLDYLIPNKGYYHLFYNVGEGWVQEPQDPLIGTTNLTWTVPDKPGKQLTLMLGTWDWGGGGWIAQTSVSGINIVSSTPTTTPSITVLSPNGGEKWVFGTPQTIKWSATGIEEGQDLGASTYLQFPNGTLCHLIDVSVLDGITNPITLQQNQQCSSISYTITPGQYKVLVYWESSVKDKKAQDYSDNYFSIVAAAATTTPTVLRTSPCSPYGDINNDNYLTDADATLISNYLVSNVSLTDDQRKKADVNNDGAITIADSLLIAQYAAGTRNTFDRCTATTTGTSTSLISAEDQLASILAAINQLIEKTKELLKR